MAHPMMSDVPGGIALMGLPLFPQQAFTCGAALNLESQLAMATYDALQGGAAQGAGGQR